MVREEVLKQFLLLRKEALKLGFDIIIDSGYKSYEYQLNVWNKKFKEKSKLLLEEATTLTDGFVARPGHFEHQTGLAFDFAIMKNGVYHDDFNDSDYESIWMMNNAHKYGFILRYPKGKENITGYRHEYWHYRYIGLPYSIECYEKDLNLEEYNELKLKR